MWFLSSFLLACLVGAAGAAQGEGSKLLVHIPFDIHNPDGFAHVRAEFGFPTVSSGRSLAQYVYWMDQSLCHSVHNETNGYPKHTTLQHPFILMANEGDCTAVTKARHAQQIGASALVIADTHCRCASEACQHTFPEDTCVDHAPRLVNDGSANDISIPTFLVYKPLAHKLKAALKTDQSVLIELRWGLTENNIESNKPNVLLWTTAHDPTMRLDHYVNLRTVISAFSDVIDFFPKYSLLDGRRFHCNTEPDSNAPCDHLCTNHGRYCTLHAKDLSGRAIVKETLRRLCIWKHFGESNADHFWDYVIYHKEFCAKPHLYADESCVHDAMQVANVDPHSVQHCVSDAGDVDQDLDNTLLDDMLTSQTRNGVVTLPSVTVNHKPLANVSPHELFSTICTEYWLSGADTIPSICEQCSSCPNVVGCIENKGKCVNFANDQRHPSTGLHRPKKSRAWKVFWISAACAAAGWVAYYYYENHWRRGAMIFGDREGLMSGSGSYMPMSATAAE